MKLRIEDISAQVKTLDFVEPQNEVNRLLEQGPIREYRVDRPFSVHLSHYRSGTELFFSGSLGAEVTATCARCAEDFSVATKRDFRFVLAPKSMGDLNGKDLNAEDLEFSLYDGEEVEVSPLIREQLLLALPTRPLCQEGCRGLCSQCGANLNLNPCSCSTQTLDPRLEALRSLKLSRH
ncbi:MAG TPA: DUF177 domain-containing protein [Candidatus Binataceae bacterium]|jgi:uncharacterized protein|nr:DUF177 domain-containing protein [Candidatus Binataceae bacterium]